jgi:hypothetical protein
MPLKRRYWKKDGNVTKQIRVNSNLLLSFDAKNFFHSTIWYELRPANRKNTIPIERMAHGKFQITD